MENATDNRAMDPLERFVAAQSGVYGQARAELTGGQKRSHWMWFIFPQIHGLGSSSMAVRYAIQSPAEALAYLEHPLLGARLRDCTAIVNGLSGRTVAQIFGYPDDLKFHSSMTLFAAVTGEESVFQEALQKYFAGQQDGASLERLRSP